MRRRDQGRTSTGRLRVALLIPLVVAAVVSALWRARRRAGREREERADTGFMRAMHDALRRDVTALEALTSERRDAREQSETMQEPWAELHQHLDRHHHAEDEDLWPVLLDHLDKKADRQQVDVMV